MLSKTDFDDHSLRLLLCTRLVPGDAFVDFVESSLTPVCRLRRKATQSMSWFVLLPLFPVRRPNFAPPWLLLSACWSEPELRLGMASSESGLDYIKSQLLLSWVLGSGFLFIRFLHGALTIVGFGGDSAGIPPQTHTYFAPVMLVEWVALGPQPV